MADRERSVAGGDGLLDAWNRGDGTRRGRGIGAERL
jgi:hypothetical protein